MKLKRSSFCQAYARSRTDKPELVDIVAVNAASEQPALEDGKRAAKRQRIYEDHKPMSAITEGMKHGRLHQVQKSTTAVLSQSLIVAVEKGRLGPISCQQRKARTSSL